MAIEIKQLVVKSKLITERSNNKQTTHVEINIESLKRELIEECTERLLRHLDERQER